MSTHQERVENTLNDLVNVSNKLGVAIVLDNGEPRILEAQL